MKINNVYYDLMEYFRRLSSTIRFNRDPSLLKQSVAEHSYHVAMLSHLVAFELRELGHKVSVEETTALALLHDFGEAFTGDILHSVKYFDQDANSALTVIEDKMMRASLPADLPRYFSDGIYAANRSDETVERHIVLVCDVLDLILHLLQELECGNRHPERMLCRGISIFMSRWPQYRPISESPMLQHLIEGAMETAGRLLSEDGKVYLEQCLQEGDL